MAESPKTQTERQPVARNAPVAIVGMGCLFPGARGVRQYWRLLRRGEDQVRDVPASHWTADDYGCDEPTEADLTYCTRGAFLDPVAFDPTEFGIPPTALESTDTAQLLTLLAAKEALADAGYRDDAAFDRSRVSVILGVTGALELVVPLGARLGHPIWRKALAEAGVDQPLADDVIRRISDAYVSWKESSFPGLLGNVVAGRIANRLNLHGTNCVVDAACASSLSAVHLGMLELSAGRSDMVLTGGTDTFNDIFMFMCFAKTQALSKSGDARPFDANADGTVIGEGVGVLALKRLDDAVRDGDRVYAVIRGVGTSSDGKSQSIYAPLAAGQARALRDAYDVSGVTPRDIELVEAHGTGTKVGDATEFDALCDVYCDASDEPWCALGSVKSQIGHTKAAAGVAGLVKAALALHHKVLPPTIKVSSPNPKLSLADGPFYLSDKPRPWLKRGDAPRAAAVSSFGFGGSNFHAVLTEHGETDDVAWDVGVDLIAFSSATAADVSAKLSDWRRWVDDTPSNAAIAHRAAESRGAFDVSQPHRVVIVADQADGVGGLSTRVDEAIRLVESSGKSNPARGVYVSTSRTAGKLAVVFSGQASQYPNMGRDLVCAFPEARRAIELAQRNVEFSQPLGSLIYPIPSFDAAVTREQRAMLTRTEIAQPALGAVSLAMWRVLKRFGVTPDMVAGHSYGELGALYSAGVIDEATLIRLSAARGAAMASSGDLAGTMLAVGAPLDDIAAMIVEQRLDVVLANRNSPTQGVLSGSVAAIDEAERCCRQRGWSVSRIDVSAAFHSQLMTSASEQFCRSLDSVSFSQPRISVFATQGGQVYPNDSAAVKSLLTTQMLSPVDFVGQIQRMRDAGATTFIEVGPKRVLTSLIGKILADDNHLTLPMDVARPDECGLARLAHVLAELAAGGFAVRLDHWNPDCPAPREQRMTVMLTGANYRADKPKSPASPPVASASNSASTIANTSRIEEPARDNIGPKNAATHGNGSTTNSSASAKFPTPRPKQQAIQSTQQSEMASTRNTVNNRPPSQSEPTNSTNPRQPSTPIAPAPHDTRLANVLETVQEGLRAMQSLQQQTAAAHQRFLEGQELAHKTFERVMEGQHQLMERLLSGGAHVNALPVQSSEAGPLHAPRSLSSQPSNGSVEPVAQPVVASKSNHEPAPLSDVERVVFDAISAATGYPIEAIHQGMDLGDDLNLDRVGRVRLLEELQKRSDRFARVDSGEVLHLSQVSQLFSLGNGHAAGGNGESVNRAVEPVVAKAGLIDEPVASADVDSGVDDDVENILLEVVAELTGYPTEMLDADMDLEADLGIDSIKRVEILATLQERIPQMKAVDSSYIGSLRTLRNIIEYIGGDAGGETVAAGSAQKKTTDPIAAGSSADQTDHSMTDIQMPQRRVVRAIELPAVTDVAGRTVRLAAGREIWIVSADAGVAAALCDRWVSAGVPCRVIDVANPPVDVRQAGGLVIIADRPAAAWSVEQSETSSWLRSVFALTAKLAGALQSAATAGGALFASVSRMDGRCGLTGHVLDPLQGSLAGLVKTASHEWPGVACRAIDVDADWDDAAAIASAIAIELAGDGLMEVGLTRSGRFGVSLDESSSLSGDLPIGSTDVVLVTGGARGVTADSVVALAQQTGAMFVLCGRSPAPTDEPAWLAGASDPLQVKNAVIANVFSGKSVTPKQVEVEVSRVLGQREIRRTLQRIAEVGGRAVYMPVDVEEAESVKAAINSIVINHGAITGLIHGAGVLADRLIAEKTIDQFDRVFGVKVDGLRNVLAAIDESSLRSLVLFSSVSARFGNSGQSDYAMANEALNKIAGVLAKRLPGCAVVSVNWGPWNGGMVTPLLAKQFEKRGVGLIEPRAGAQMLVAEMRQPPGADVEVVIGDGLMAEPQSGVGRSNDCDTARHCDSPVVNIARTTVLCRRVAVSSHPFLGDHVVGGRPVLPAAMMLEWMAHGAMHANPGLRLSRIENFRVLRAVAFDADAVDLVVDSGKVERDGEQFVAPIELRSGESGDVLHARAGFALDYRLNEAPVAKANAIDRGAFAIDVDAVYRDILFHGPRFRAIESLTAADEQGLAATLRVGVSPEDWMDAPLRSEWIVDPLIVDGVLQLGIVWCHARLEALSLPSRIARLEVFESSRGSGAHPTERVQVTLDVIRSADHRMTADAVVADDGGRVLMRFSGIEWTVDASLRAAIAPAATAAMSQH